MATFKCKMCGATLEIEEGKSVATCEYCGSTQTVPVVDDEKKLTLFARANRLRFGCEFDKAAGIYESIIQDFPEEAEAYWGLVLCKYGIEYIDDGISGKKIPTCHRTRPTSVMEDDDFAQACENADVLARDVYRSEAKEIDRIQRKILEIAGKEDPYDIFICYKETDDRTKSRTEDSTIAQDIYTELSGEGYRVFFARVSLRSVAGSEYEPYIYAALSSSKVMLAIGTKFEYYDAIWVKNEWSRFLDMMKNDTKKVLIPCFRDMDAYDMPKEFKNLQGLDMGEVTFFKNLSESIGKTIEKKRKEPKQAQAAPLRDMSAPTVDPLLKRMTLFLADGDFAKANEYAERVLDASPECAEAYLGKLMAELKVSRRGDLTSYPSPIDGYENFKKAIRFGDTALISELTGYADGIKEHIRLSIEKSNEAAYRAALADMNAAKTTAEFQAAATRFGQIAAYSDAKAKQQECLMKAKDKTVVTYSKAVAEMDSSKPDEAHALSLIDEVIGYADAKQQRAAFVRKIYDAAKQDMDQAKWKPEGSKERTQAYAEIANRLDLISDYKNAAELRDECLKLAEACREKLKQNEKSTATAHFIIMFVVLAALVGGIIALVLTCTRSAISHVYQDGLEYVREGDAYYLDGPSPFGGETPNEYTIPDQIRGLPVLGIKTANGLQIVQILTLPEGITEIPDRLFVGYADHLKKIILPNSMTVIGNAAFSGCTSLEEITIPGSVTTIGEEAFKDCTGLTSITIENGVTSIGKRAFSGCTSLEEITIPGSVPTIGEEAFKNCIGLTSITIKNGVASIDAQAFSGCTALTSITLESGLTSIGEQAFSGCSALTSITIPDSVTSMGKNALLGCSGLTSLTLPFTGSDPEATQTGYLGYLFGQPAFGSYNSYVPEKLKTVVLTRGTKVQSGAFSSCSNITSITIPETITAIEYAAFSGCSSLTDFQIPSGVTSIGEKAFEGCAAFTSIQLPDGLLSIGESAFSGCKQIEELVIPDSVTSMGKNALYGWEGLTNLTLPFTGSDPEATQAGYLGYLFGQPAFGSYNSYVPEKLKTVVLTRGTKVQRGAFSSCSNITSITIPETITAIEYAAFSGCSNLTDFQIPSGVTSIGEKAFEGCAAFTSIQLPDGLLSIGENAFSGCKQIEELVIPDSVTSMGKNALYGCSGLTSLTLPFTGSDPEATQAGRLGYLFGQPAFGSYNSYVPENLKTVVLTRGTKIQNGAFSDCPHITSITISATVTEIGNDAFRGCTGLTSITFGGTKEQWNSINKGSAWNNDTGDYIIHCTDGDIAK